MADEPDGLIEGAGAAQPVIPSGQVLGNIMLEILGPGQYNIAFNNVVPEAVPTILRKAAIEMEKKLLQ